MADRRGWWRIVPRALSEPPAAPWPWGVIHHGARLALLAASALTFQALFPVAPAPDFPVLERGMVADEDVIAEVDFDVLKSEQELAAEQAEAAASATPVFDVVPSAVDSLTHGVDRFFSQIDTISAAAPDEDARARAVAALLAEYRLEATPQILELLQSRNRRNAVRRAIDTAARQDLAQGYAASAELARANRPRLLLRDGADEVLVPLDSIRTGADFFEIVPAYLGRGADPSTATFARQVAVRFFQPSIRFSQIATENEQRRLRAAVPTTKGRVLAGERIIAAHEQVSADVVEKLAAYRARLDELDRLEGSGSWSRKTGRFLFDMLLLGILGVLLYFFRPAVYADLRHVLVITLLTLVLGSAAAIVASSGWPMVMIPIALPVLVIAALWDGRLALSYALIVSILLSTQAPFGGVSPLFTMVLAGAAAAMAVRVVLRRSQTWVFVSVIAGAYAVAGIVLTLLRGLPFSSALGAVGWGVANAAGSAVLAMALLPLFEAYTRITTDQTLLELGDLNRPLLKRLALEAPGTYVHSINVAHLAEAAARAISANTLLARIGAYYHDVGKVVKPQYFIENQPPGRNPHDRLKPATSATMVRNHVLEGVRLAEEAKLPDSVKAFIKEHHGTQLISFFYDQAREVDPDLQPDPRVFRYPGPTPRSRETALLMLADSVESATRVLSDPTPERIKEVVDQIVDGKLAQHQLDESPMTFGDLRRVREVLVTSLTNVYHQRIDYPNGVKADGPRGRDAAPGDAAVGAGAGSSGPGGPAGGPRRAAG
ncbi:MAG TPA: HDIG domain-containing protein [Longimicrobiales bacterium]|nr:HDIG domain-containing protein [Longimicrobiales bacterium]